MRWTSGSLDHPRVSVGMIVVLTLAAWAAPGCTNRSDVPGDLEFDPADVMDPLEGCPAGTPVGDPVCSADFGDVYATNSLRETYAFLLGRWRQCSVEKEPGIDGSLPKGIGDHDGLDFLSGGELELLFLDGSGELFHVDGLDYEGDVTEGLNGSTSLTFEMDYGRDCQVKVVGSACPRKLRISYCDGPTHVREYRAEVE